MNQLGDRRNGSTSGSFFAVLLSAASNVYRSGSEVLSELCSWMSGRDHARHHAWKHRTWWAQHTDLSERHPQSTKATTEAGNFGLPPSHLVGSADTRERSTAQLDCTQAPRHELELDQIPIRIGVSGARYVGCNVEASVLDAVRACVELACPVVCHAYTSAAVARALYGLRHVHVMSGWPRSSVQGQREYRTSCAGCARHVASPV